MKILYISLTGMTEPLGESQVLQYLLELTNYHSIYLLSFERSCDKAKIRKLQTRLQAANIEWQYFKYSNRYGVASTAWQITSAFYLLSKWIKKNNIQIIHARSLIPAVIGMLMKKIFKVKLIFDIRGFAIDEKIVDRRLKEQSILTKFLKKFETYVFKKADHIVTLTHVSKPLIHAKYNIPEKIITVIPTCANAELFKRLSPLEKTEFRKTLGFSAEDFIVLHNGSLNGWVDFQAELKLFEQLAKFNSNMKFLFLNKGQHQLIESYLQKYSFNTNSCKIVTAEFNEVFKYLNIADVCVFFIKPSYAKLASAPTKFAEIIACHCYSVTNTRYGDMEFYFNHYQVGLLMDLDDINKNPNVAAHKVIKFIDKNKENENNPQQFDQLFSEHLSKTVAIERYMNIYNQLSQNIKV